MHLAAHAWPFPQPPHLRTPYVAHPLNAVSLQSPSCSSPHFWATPRAQKTQIPQSASVSETALHQHSQSPPEPLPNRDPQHWAGRLPPQLFSHHRRHRGCALGAQGWNLGQQTPLSVAAQSNVGRSRRAKRLQKNSSVAKAQLLPKETPLPAVCRTRNPHGTTAIPCCRPPAGSFTARTVRTADTIKRTHSGRNGGSKQQLRAACARSPGGGGSAAELRAPGAGHEPQGRSPGPTRGRAGRR